MVAHNTDFRKYYDLGYEYLVPIVPPDAPLSPRSTLYKRTEGGKDARGKAVGVCGEDGLWHGYDWFRAPPATPEQLERWAAMGAGVGIRTGHGVVALDIDALTPEHAAAATDLACATLGPAPLRYGRAPKCLLVYATTEAIPYQRIEFDDGGKPGRVELLSEGRQFVVSGIHPATRKPYIWERPLCGIDYLPLVSQAKIDAYFRALAELLPNASAPVAVNPTPRAEDQSALKGNLEAVQKAVSALPNTSDLFPTYDDYIRVGAAIKGATQDEPDTGLDLFLQWAGRWDGGNDPERAAADYHRIKHPYSIGADYLYDLATRHGDGFGLGDVLFDDLTDETHQTAALNQELATAIQAAGAAVEARASSKPFVSLVEAAKTATSGLAKPLIKGLLDQGAFSVLYGRSNSGKEFVAMDIAYHVATGMAWGGMRTAKLPVVYIAAEGGAGARKRAAALIAKYGEAAALESQFVFVLASIDLFSKENDTPGLIKAVKGLFDGKVGLIVVDTLARAMAGGDENSAQDMGTLVRNIDKIRAETLAHVMVIHHSGKDAAKGARGSNSLLGAVDTELEIADSVIRVTKQRDLDKAFASGFVLEEHILGEDADGEFVTSCSVKLVAAKAVTVGVPSPDEANIFEAVKALESLQEADKGITIGEIKDYTGAETDTAIRTHVKRMLSKRLIEVVAKGRYKTVQENTSSA